MDQSSSCRSDMETTSAAEQRAFAVAKLKRAASLPRMKDGRRPPMHAEAVSEGERTTQSDEQLSQPQTEEKESVAEKVEKKEEEVVPAPSDGKEEEIFSEGTRTMSPETTTRSKRRSRSRSRSRTSKDLRGKARAATPNALSQSNDSSPDDSPAPLSSAAMLVSTPLISPIPSRIAGLQGSPFFLSPPMSPDTLALYPGTSPSTPMLPIPTLLDLQREMGLSRSNSAAARLMAMQKLNGEPYDRSASPFPSASPAPGKVSRNNTVSGGERSAARKNLLRLLGERMKDANGDQTSGGEEIAAPSPPPRRRRRRSRKGSVSASAPIDESDIPSTSPNTPVVPQTPLPPTPLPFDAIPEPRRAPSTTPSLLENLERNRSTALAKLTGEKFEYEPQRKRRSVVVEDEDDAPEVSVPPSYNQLPATPKRPMGNLGNTRIPHSSDAPSNTSTDSAPASAIPVPFYLSAAQGTPSRGDQFPSSPFTTPLKENPSREEEVSRDENEEEVLYQADTHRSRQQSPYHDAYDREISWVADPVPESRIPINDDYDEDEEEDEERETDDAEPEEEPTQSTDFSPHDYDDSQPRNSADSKELVIEIENSPEPTPSYVPPSPSSALALSNAISLAQVSDDSNSPRVYPARLSVASPVQFDRSPSNGEFVEWDESRLGAIDTSAKRNGDAPSTWEKVRNTFTRSGSSSGRRSRSNSIATRDRRDHTDSSVSRESGASLTSARVEPPSTFAQQQSQSPLMQTLSASASITSLSPQTPARSGVSPIPPASQADMQKYKDVAKLFPFPGIKKLEEERNRTRRVSLSASSPDIVLSLQGYDPDSILPHSSSSTNTPAQSPLIGRDRKLSHQASDTRLLPKYNSPSMASAPSTSSNIDYFNIPSVSPAATPGSLNLKLPLPTNREGVKKWLSKNKLFSSQSSSPNTSISSPATSEIRSPNANKKPSLSDLFRGRKENDLMGDWEEIGSEKSRTPTSASGSTLLGKYTNDMKEAPSDGTPNGKCATLSDVEKTPKARKVAPETNGPPSYYPHLDSTPPFPSPSDPPSSATPDPLSSIDDYPTRSTSGSSSNTSSQYSSYTENNMPSQGTVVLERLDEMLGRGSRSPMWASAIDDPPRKLILSSPVLQVVNSNTVKDRFLFLFTDLLIVAKPIVQEQDTFLDNTKPNPADRKFIVKSVVLLSQLRFNADRDEPQSHKASASFGVPRNPLIRTFVHQFAKDPDHAISSLFDKAGARDDPIALGQLLFKTTDLDRARLGSYLARRTSKFVLKAYLDGFGFTGLRVDRALRVFLHSVNVPNDVPTGSHTASSLELLLDAFASRWYEANAGIVAFDKDMAIRLVRAVVQLNDVLHGGIAQEPGPTLYPKRNVTNRDFAEAFRRWDPRCLVSDETLGSVCNSVRRERLSQARKPSSGTADASITIKRPLPPRLTYKVQSEPIILRIPQPDPQLTILLFGQDLTFEPTSLSFAKSSEASFRVTGNSLGSKTMTMLRSGPNALLYSGLPPSSTIVIERAFMRNTFQVAFANHKGLKRRYMFSVDDPIVRHQWTVSLKQQIDSASSASSSSSSPGASKFHRAAESTSFRVLQDILLGLDDVSASRHGSAINKVIHRLATSPQPGSNSDSSLRQSSDSNGRPNDKGASHARSKSRSAVYHRHGPGKLEPDLNGSERDDSFDSLDGDEKGRLLPRSEGRLWSGRALEMQCQQNSSIALVLAYLQVGAPGS